MALGLVFLYLAARLAQKWIKNEGASCLGLIVQGASCLTFSEECIPNTENTITAAAMTANRITSLRELLHY